SGDPPAQAGDDLAAQPGGDHFVVKTFKHNRPWRYRQGRFDTRTAEVGLTLPALVACSLAGCGRRSDDTVPLTSKPMDKPGYTPISWTLLAGFEFNQIDGTLADVPEKYRKLDGQRVMLVGTMWAFGETGTVRRFALVPKRRIC
ncbi:MAG TPA: hypothetical protein VIL86_01950, partial [Tepidisphaeraceae bacterium]